MNIALAAKLTAAEAAVLLTEEEASWTRRWAMTGPAVLGPCPILVVQNLLLVHEKLVVAWIPARFLGHVEWLTVL